MAGLDDRGPLFAIAPRVAILELEQAPPYRDKNPVTQLGDLSYRLPPPKKEIR
jgi:hypothetical protein